MKYLKREIDLISKQLDALLDISICVRYTKLGTLNTGTIDLFNSIKLQLSGTELI